MRGPEEFAVSHLRSAVNLRTNGEVEEAIARQRPSRTVLYCSVGFRSSRLANLLAQRGVREFSISKEQSSNAPMKGARFTRAIRLSNRSILTEGDGTGLLKPASRASVESAYLVLNSQGAGISRER